MEGARGWWRALQGSWEEDDVLWNNSVCIPLCQGLARNLVLGLRTGVTDGEVTTHWVFYLCYPWRCGVSWSHSGYVFTMLVRWCIVWVYYLVYCIDSLGLPVVWRSDCSNRTFCNDGNVSVVYRSRFLLACGVDGFTVRNFVTWLLSIIISKKLNCMNLLLNIILKIKVSNTQHSLLLHSFTSFYHYGRPEVHPVQYGSHIGPLSTCNWLVWPEKGILNFI